MKRVNLCDKIYLAKEKKDKNTKKRTPAKLTEKAGEKKKKKKEEKPKKLRKNGKKFEKQKNQECD